MRNRFASSATFFVLPALVVLAAITLFPFLFSLHMSAFNIDLTKPYLPRLFVGLSNYARLLTDARALNAFLVTFWFILGVVVTEAALGLTLAVFLQRYFRGSRLLIALVVLPMLIPRVVAALLWRVMYNPLVGVINYFSGRVGVTNVEWLASPSLALPAVIVADVWQWTPFFVLILSAALEVLPTEPFEAAAIDGAHGWVAFRFITLPLLAPILTVAVLFRLIDSLRSFDLVFVMTGGGPGISTETVDIYAYLVGISQAGKISYAASLSIVTLYVTVALTTLLLRGIRKWQERPA